MSVEAARIESKHRAGAELCKWLGLVAMLYDHLAMFLDAPLPWAEEVGAFALPLFTIAIADTVSVLPPEKVRQVGWRLVKWGALAQVAVVFVRDPVPLNIIFTLGFGVFAFAWSQVDGWRSWVYTTAVVALSLLSEFSILGGAFVLVALMVYAKGVGHWWLALVALPLYMFNRGSLLAVPATLLAIWLVELNVGPPRIKRVFYFAYVGQWVAFAIWNGWAAAA